MKGIYFEVVLEQLPRLLSLMDRNPSSATYGCFDRSFWHYKIVDFPCMRMQEAALTLALLTKTKQNIINNSSLKELSKASIKFWKNNMASDGSASEWYPNEKSYVATAFSSYAVAAAAEVLNAKNEELIAALRKSAKWLIGKTEEIAQNQQSGAIAAILAISKLADDPLLKKKAIWLLRDLGKKQTKEGWFSEYNGPDIGYLSLTVDYLAKSAKLLEGKEAGNAMQMAIKASEFIKNFLHADYTIGGEYCSRNTEYLIPSGFEALSAHSKSCAQISYFIRKALKKRTIAGPYSLDDRYLAYNLYTYMEAALAKGRKINKAQVGLNSINFPEAMIYIRKTESHQIILNLAKGGSFALFLGKKTIRDSGLRFKSPYGFYTTGFLDYDNIAHVTKTKEKETFSAAGRCVSIKNQLMTPAKHAALRAFQMSAGKYLHISSLLKGKLRKALITSGKKSKFSYKRTINLYKNSIEIIDEIAPAQHIEEIFLGLKASELYIPSAKFFNAADNQEFYKIKRHKENKITIIRTIKGRELGIKCQIQ